MSDTPPPRRRTAENTRAQILQVAMRLFTEKGFEATTTRDIATALGMNQSSLYYHFKGKDDIVRDLVQHRRDDLSSFVDWITVQPHTPELLRTAALRWIDGTTPESLHAMRLALANPTMQHRILGPDLDLRSGFESVIAHFITADTSGSELVLIRMTFDTMSAALLAAHGTDAPPADILDAARRAVLALTQRSEYPSSEKEAEPSQRTNVGPGA